MSKKILILTSILLSTYLLSAQKPKITFQKSSISVGSIKEEAGIVNIKFTFKNTGKTPLVINDIETSCGCTTPIWDKKPVLPNSTAQITALLNPRNRSGSFLKTITVHSNAENAIEKLQIKGRIIPRKRTIEDNYIHNMNGLRVKTPHIPLLNIKNTQNINYQLEIINTNTTPTQIKYSNNLKHITIHPNAQTIQSKEKRTITIKYNAKEKNEFGFNLDTIKFIVNNKNESILISSTISEDFSSLTQSEYKNRPIIKLNEDSYFFNKKMGLKEIKHYFYITNEGNSDLLIHKISTSSPSLHINCKEQIIKSKEQIKIEYTLNITSKTGIQNKSITIISNAPDSPIIKYKIKGMITKL